MDLENQTSSQADQSAQPNATVPAPATAQPTSGAAPVTGSNETPNVSEVPAWTPDYKFKVMDKEHEIDPVFHPIIKDEDTLKKIKRMHEQSLGIPHLEQSREEFKTKYTTALPRLQEYERVETKLNKLSSFVERGDYDSFFADLKIPEQKILAWVKQKLDLMEAPPQVREQFERNRMLEQQQYDLMQQNQSYQQQAEQIETQKAIYTVDQTINQLAGAEASFYNERMQNPEAFREYVIAKGQQYQLATGQRAPLQQVIESVKQEFQRLGVSVQQPNQSAAQVPQNGVPTPGVIPAANKPTIPAIKAGSASPVQTPVKSLKDLKDRAAAL